MGQCGPTNTHWERARRMGLGETWMGHSGAAGKVWLLAVGGVALGWGGPTRVEVGGVAMAR